VRFVVVVNVMAALTQILAGFAPVVTNASFNENIGESFLEEAMPPSARLVSGERGTPNNVTYPRRTVEKRGTTGAGQLIGTAGERSQESHSERCGEIFWPDTQSGVLQPRRAAWLGGNPQQLCMRRGASAELRGDGSVALSRELRLLLHARQLKTPIAGRRVCVGCNPHRARKAESAAFPREVRDGLGVAVRYRAAPASPDPLHLVVKLRGNDQRHFRGV
jgi:hypothetical protein